LQSEEHYFANAKNVNRIFWNSSCSVIFFDFA